MTLPATALPLFAAHFSSLQSAVRELQPYEAVFAPWNSTQRLSALSQLIQANVFNVSLYRAVQWLQPHSAPPITQPHFTPHTLSPSDSAPIAWYPRAQLLNHACTGHHNVVLASRPPQLCTRSVTFVAARPIAKGEELLWAYGGAAQRERMHRTYGFLCQCPAHS